jgi:hypothetical protein
MQNAHARLIASAVLVVAGAVLTISPAERDMGKPLMGVAGVFWLIDFIVLAFLPERKRRQDRQD